MTGNNKARTGPGAEDKAGEDTAAQDEPRDDTGKAHAELVPAGKGPRPRARVLPPEVGEDDEDGDDDPFNDMPV